MKRSAETSDEGQPPVDDSTVGKQVRLDPDPVGSVQSAATSANSGGAEKKRQRQTKKAIIMLMYSGTGYYGMQRNSGFQTIEGVLFDCLFAGGHITLEEHMSANKLQFQRASKTDKGVSALAQVVSLWLDLSDPAALKVDLASRLPPEVRLLDVFRTTRNFNCKARVNHREYAYICPSYTFASKSRPIDISYRIDAGQLALLRSCLSRYKGTKNFYNFTSGRQAGDASCNRYIIDFVVGEPFVYRDGEFVELLVRGQSFMLHQIRKMVGLAVAIVKGYCPLTVLDSAFTFKRMDIPRAPGLGLLLSKVDYGAYNKKYAEDLGYPTIDWDRFIDERQQFKSDLIMPEIYRGETEANGSMLEWLKTLTMHSYDFLRVPGPSIGADVGGGKSDEAPPPSLAEKPADSGSGEAEAAADASEVEPQSELEPAVSPNAASVDSS